MSLRKDINRHSYLATLFLGIFIICISSIAKADAPLIKNAKVRIEADEDAIAVIKDKSGEYFQIRYQVSLKSGKAYGGYDIQNVKGGKITLLGGGSYDGIDGTCGQGFRKEILNFKKAVSPSIKFFIKDLNNDKYLDIFAEFIEEDCETGEKSTITNIFYATDKGFVLAEGDK